MDILLVSLNTASSECALITSVAREKNAGICAVDSYKRAIEELARKKYLIAVVYSFAANSDIRLAEAIRIMKQIVPEVLVVAIAEDSPLEFERELRKSGLYYYLTRPFGEEELKDVLWSAIEKQTRRRTK